MSDYSSYMWSVPDWRTDEMYTILDNREKGIYRELIDECWVNGSITSNPETLARFVREDLAYFTEVWVKIRKKFRSIQNGERLISKRLEEDRGRLKGIRKSRTSAGAKGNAEKRRRREAAAKAGGNHTDEQWLAMCILADFRCVQCGTKPLKLERDHITPLYQGGTHSIANIQPMCRHCNGKKGRDSTDLRKFDWQQLNDLSVVSRTCESFASRLRDLKTRQTQTQTQKEGEKEGEGEVLSAPKDSSNLKNSPLLDSPKTEKPTARSAPAERDAETTGQPVREKGTRRRTQAPRTLDISDDMRRWAQENGITVDLDAETAAMLDHHRGKGNLHLDWVATWRTWMRNSKKFNRGNGNGTRQSTTAEINDRASEDAMRRALAPKVR